MVVTQPDRDTEERADVCIVGSGAAGSVLSWKLLNAGHSVVVLEKGDYYPKEDLETWDEENLLRLWKNSGSQLTRNYSVNIAQGECVGGSTVINYGICFKTPESVLDEWTRDYGVSSMTSEDMAPFFDELETNLHVTEIPSRGKNHEVLRKGCEGLGYKASYMRRNCLGCTSKQSMLETYLKWADEKGAKVYANTAIETILVRNGKAAGVRGATFDKKTGKKHRISINSSIVILAAGAIASSEILLKNNLGNRSGQVGKHLSLHPSPAMIAEFDEEIEGHRDIPMAFACYEFGVLNTKQHGFTIESVFLPPFQFATVIPGIGLAHKEMMARYRNYAMAGILVHDDPVGQISLNWSREAVIDYGLSDSDKQKVIRGMKEVAKIFFAADARKIITSHLQETVLNSEKDLYLIDERGAEAGALLLGSAHPQGGNRMGEDRRKSVVNSFCEAHDVPNLFVCDASVFPTSIGVNPQLTVMAIASRTAKHVAENARRYFA